MPALNKRWTSSLSIAAVFLFCLILLHNNSSSRPLPLPQSRLSRSQCPSTPPSPAYTRSNPDEGFSWRDIPVQFPVSNLISLPFDTPSTLPEIQARFTPATLERETLRKSRQSAVKATFQRAWHSYEKHAWKADELRPLSGGSRNNFGGWGATLVDNLDTLLIMDMHDEFERAVTALLDVDFSPHSSSQSTINIFETTIRYLGGFIAAYDLSGCTDVRLLDKAVQIADMIYASFDTPTRMPVTRWNPHKAAGGESQAPAANGIIAELASSSLELTRLSQLTGDMRYFDAISRITDTLDAQAGKTRVPGMWPVGIDVAKPDLTRSSTFSFGGMADSAYEYLPKEYQLLAGAGTGTGTGAGAGAGAGTRAQQYRHLAENALNAGSEYLLFRPMVPDHADILLPGIGHATGRNEVQLETRSEHLACFVGGMYALAGKLFPDSKADFLSTGKRLTDGCIWFYKNSPLGIMPEMFSVSQCPRRTECVWDDTQEDVYTYVRDKNYKLRPEALESVFYMWRITGDEMYREAAWEMFQAIDAVTKTEFANAAVRDVTADKKDVEMEDSMESFWMAETLKYLYLIFSEPELVSLDEFVFNTEAHPFRIPR